MKLLPTLFAAVFAAVTFSAVAADAMAPVATTTKVAPAVKAEKSVAAAKPVGKTASPKQRAQRAKMSLCSKEAKGNGLKSAEYKSFMKSCLKKDSTVVASTAQ